MVEKSKRDYTQKIQKQITPTTPSTATGGHANKYPYRDLWTKSLDAELDKVDENGIIRCLEQTGLGLIPKYVKVNNMTMSSNNKTT